MKSLTTVKFGTNFSTHGDLKTHILTHSEKKLSVCCICGEWCCGYSHLKTHTSRYRFKIAFVCGICGKYFSWGNLTAPILTQKILCRFAPRLSEDTVLES